MSLLFVLQLITQVPSIGVYVLLALRDINFQVICTWMKLALPSLRKESNEKIIRVCATHTAGTQYVRTYV